MFQHRKCFSCQAEGWKSQGALVPFGHTEAELERGCSCWGRLLRDLRAQPCWDLGSVTVLGLSAVNTALFVFLRGVLSGTVYGRTKGINIHNFPECAL